MDPALILGPYGVVIILAYAVKHLYQENQALRDKSMELLEKYQERDEEERKALLAEVARLREEKA